MSAYAGPEILENALVLCLDPANKKSYPGSGTTITDLSLQRNNGSLSGATYVSGSYNSYLEMNGSISVGDSSSLVFTNIFSFSIWTSASNMQQYAGLLGRSTNDFWEDGWGVYYDNVAYNGIFFFINDWRGSAGGNDGVLIGHNIGTNSFPITNYVGTYDGSTVKLYANGNLISQSSYSTNVQNPTTSLKLMSMTGNDTLYKLNGQFYNSSLYNRVLSEQEIQQNFNALRGRFGI